MSALTCWCEVGVRLFVSRASPSRMTAASEGLQPPRPSAINADPEDCPSTETSESSPSEVAPPPPPPPPDAATMIRELANCLSSVTFAPAWRMSKTLVVIAEFISALETISLTPSSACCASTDAAFKSARPAEVGVPISWSSFSFV